MSHVLLLIARVMIIKSPLLPPYHLDTHVHPSLYAIGVCCVSIWSFHRRTFSLYTTIPSAPIHQYVESQTLDNNKIVQRWGTVCSMRSYSCVHVWIFVRQNFLSFPNESYQNIIRQRQEQTVQQTWDPISLEVFLRVWEVFWVKYRYYGKYFMMLCIWFPRKIGRCMN